MQQAANSVSSAQFRARADEYTCQFQVTTAQAQDMWQQAHDVQMGRQKAESDQVIGQLKNEANAHMANIAEKLEASKRNALETIETVKLQAAKEILDKTQSLKLEPNKKKFS